MSRIILYSYLVFMLYYINNPSQPTCNGAHERINQLLHTFWEAISTKIISTLWLEALFKPKVNALISINWSILPAPIEHVYLKKKKSLNFNNVNCVVINTQLAAKPQSHLPITINCYHTEGLLPAVQWLLFLSGI